MSQSPGQMRVDTSFNPSQLPEVDQVKGVTLTVIDNLQPYVDQGGNRGRLARIAQDKYEEACMFAVKALTAQPGM